jgi:hypothetical protein
MKFIDYFLCNIAISFVIRIICIVLSIFYCFKYDDINILMVMICIMMFLTWSIIFDCFIYTYFNNNNVLLELSVNLIVYISLIISLLSVSGNLITTSVLLMSIAITLGIILFLHIVFLCFIGQFFKQQNKEIIEQKNKEIMKQKNKEIIIDV